MQNSLDTINGGLNIFPKGLDTIVGGLDTSLLALKPISAFLVRSLCVVSVNSAASFELFISNKENPAAEIPSVNTTVPNIPSGKIL